MNVDRDDLAARRVCDGQVVLARIYGAEDGPFEAVMANERSLGCFRTMRTAREAVSEALSARMATMPVHQSASTGNCEEREVRAS